MKGVSESSAFYRHVTFAPGSCSSMSKYFARVSQYKYFSVVARRGEEWAYSYPASDCGHGLETEDRDQTLFPDLRRKLLLQYLIVVKMFLIKGNKQGYILITVSHKNFVQIYEASSSWFQEETHWSGEETIWTKVSSKEDQSQVSEIQQTGQASSEEAGSSEEG